MRKCKFHCRVRLLGLRPQLEILSKAKYNTRNTISIMLKIPAAVFLTIGKIEGDYGTLYSVKVLPVICKIGRSFGA